MYAQVIVDITHEKLDRSFEYHVPEALLPDVFPGCRVLVPFGRGDRLIKAYVIALTEKLSFKGGRIKTIDSVLPEAMAIEGHLIRLAGWMREQYGATMNQALKTVLPIKEKTKVKQVRYIKSLLSVEEVRLLLEESKKKQNLKARIRFLEGFSGAEVLSEKYIKEELGIAVPTIRFFIESGNFVYLEEQAFRNPIQFDETMAPSPALNEAQAAIVKDILRRYDNGDLTTSLIHGVTGSGKTEVYMELIDHMISLGRQVILLIPEIALTYQTSLRFYRRFGDRVSIINSKLSKGERFDQFERARKGQLDIMIGPRSALFTPFSQLGMIIIDEEHEGSYQSETAPRYDARETAIRRSQMCQGMVVLGSATPSVESYHRCERGIYTLYQLKERAKAGSLLPDIQVIDLRKELKSGNKSIFSHTLTRLIKDRLVKQEQTILFLNRRGYAGFLSCRMCGKAIKCPHCDVSLTTHRDGSLNCHYCGYKAVSPRGCPSCGSEYMAAFGIGTQKVEDMAKEAFPQARVLRMDFDTTRKKGDYERILSAFHRGEGDILIGTQMIVKGHDFERVTLVGVLAADLSLNSPNYKGSEKTFQLITQAVGRSGRGEYRGTAVIQTYQPDHHAIISAAAQDFASFYQAEMAYRNLLSYPPAGWMVSVMISSGDEKAAGGSAAFIKEGLQVYEEKVIGLMVIGPGDAPISRIKDIYRKMLYIKHTNRGILVKIKNQIELWQEEYPQLHTVTIQFDFNQ